MAMLKKRYRAINNIDLACAPDVMGLFIQLDFHCAVELRSNAVLNLQYNARHK